MPVHGAPVVELYIAPAVQPGTALAVVHGAPVVELYIAPAAHPGTVETAPPPAFTVARVIGPKYPTAGVMLLAV